MVKRAHYLTQLASHHGASSEGWINSMQAFFILPDLNSERRCPIQAAKDVVSRRVLIVVSIDALVSALTIDNAGEACGLKLALIKQAERESLDGNFDPNSTNKPC